MKAICVIIRADWACSQRSMKAVGVVSSTLSQSPHSLPAATPSSFGSSRARQSMNVFIDSQCRSTSRRSP